MAGMRTGLRRRLERTLRTVEQQHRQLKDVDGELAQAIARGAVTEAQRWLERMRDALLAHFDLEEEVIFPALRGLLPGTHRELAQLERDHQLFLERLHAALGAVPHAARLDRDQTELRRRLDEHERHEERLLALALALEELEQPQK
jgi:hypothetical protein